MNEKKIRIMTALAVYDKGAGKMDRKADGYYKTDYIYKKNLFTRIGLMAGLVVLLFFKFMNMFFVQHIDYMAINYKLEVGVFVILAVAALVLYTVLGSFLGAREYNQAFRRLKNYHMLLEKLSDIEVQEKEEKQYAVQRHRWIS